MNSKHLSILSKVSSADIVHDPYPHIVIENALDDALYQELFESLPSEELVLDGREKKNTWFDYPACKVVDNPNITPLWQEFFRYHTSSQFYLELIEKFGETLKELHPGLETKLGKTLEESLVAMRPGGRQNRLADNADISMECQFYVNYTTQERAVRGPHVDRPSELFAALLYFRAPEDDSKGGDLVVSKAKEPDSLYPSSSSIRVDHAPMEIDNARVAPTDTGHYQANTLVLFLNSPKSIHAVSARNATNIARRHINFCCDLNFDLFSIEKPARDTLKEKIEGAPIIWRLAKWL